MAEVAIRVAYGQALKELGEKNNRVVALDADVSSSTMSKFFGQAFPDRYYNMGIAELGMINTAVGLASSGFIPFVNTFATFMSTRASDTIQGMVSYDRMHIVLAGAYGGLSDSYDGASHQAITDIALMRALPEMTVIVPSDPVQTRQAVFAAAEEANGPVYLRLSRAETPQIYRDDSTFQIGKGVLLREGADIAIIAAGTVVHSALNAAESLLAKGIHAAVVDMHTITPIDKELLLGLAKETRAIVTVEEHMVRGGLASAVAEVLAEECPTRMKAVGMRGFAESGDYAGLFKKYGLDGESVEKSCLALLDEKKD